MTAPTIIYLSRRYPPSVGGMQRLSRELHQALAIRLPVRAVAWGGSQAWLPLFGLVAALRSVAWLLRGRTDAVVLAGDALLAPLGLALARLFGRRCAGIVHGLDFLHPNPLIQAIVPAALRRLDLVVAISQSTRRLAVARGVDPDRCLAIPCAVEPRPLPPRDEARARLARSLGLDLPEDRPLMITVGRLAPRKGVAWFVRACLPAVLARQPAACYLVAGDGPERAAIEAAVGLVGDAARVLGRVDDATRDDLWAAADLFVMPNRPRAGDAEGFGLVAAEAAHAGLPTVATTLEAIPEAVVDGVTGRLVPPELPDAFVDAIVTLLADRPGLGRLGASARDEAKRRFSWDVVGDRYALALARLAERPLPTAAAC